MLLALSLTTLDLVVLGLCGLFALRGAFKGFVWQAVRLAALFGALWGAGAWYGWLADRLRTWFTFLPEKSVPFVAWGVVFFGLLLLGAYLAHMARGLIRTAELSGVDRLTGFALGAATGLGLCTLLLLVGAAAMNTLSQRAALEGMLRGSTTLEPMTRAASLLEPLLPDGVRAVWTDLRANLAPGS